MSVLAYPGWALMARLPKGRFGGLLATVAVATVIVGGASLIPKVVTGGGGGGGGVGGTTTANLWVDPTGGSCVDNSGLVAYQNNGTECSLPAAYAAAEPGDLIGVKGGTYSGNWVLAYRGDLASLTPRCDPYGKFGTASSANCVRITNYTGDTVTLTGNLEFHGPSVWLNGVTTGTMANWKARTFSFNVGNYTSVEGDSGSNWPNSLTIEGLNTGNFGTYSSQYVYALDIDVGPQMLDLPCNNFVENRIGANGATGGVLPRNIIWERVAIHDQNRTLNAANADCHYGGLQFWASDNVTLTHIVMERNVVYHIDMGESGFGPTNGVISQSSFGCPADNSWVGDVCDGQRAVQFSLPEWDETAVTLSGNVAANGTNGLYGCGWGTPCDVNVSGNTDLAESTDAPAVP